MRSIFIHTVWMTFFLLVNVILFGQASSSSTPDKSIYNKSWSLGFRVHTSGIGGEFRKEKFRTATFKNFWNVSLFNIKHPKEQKSIRQGANESSFIYGKMNSFYLLNGGVGAQKIIFEKMVTRGVQISTVYSINLTLGILKPVYLDVFRDDLLTTSQEAYDPNKHPFEKISSKAPWINGVGESKFVPGAGARFGLNFEFSPEDDQIKALETGIKLNGFLQPIPLMAHNQQNNLFFNLYISFLFGRKSYL